MIRFVIALIFTALCSPSWSATYNIDLNGPLPVGVTAGPLGRASTNYCGPTDCAGGLSNPAYSFSAKPGDVLNFGSVTLTSFVFADFRSIHLEPIYDSSGNYIGDAYGAEIGSFSGSVKSSDQFSDFLLLNGPNSMCFSGDPSCQPWLESQMGTTTIPLVFTLTTTGFIEFGWTDPSAYNPPAFSAAVPEASTWAMLLMGFLVLGMVTHNRPTRSIRAV